ncbi:hypothetical protein IAT38_004394 [Cryptococcus sp. DSM 104549]
MSAEDSHAPVASTEGSFAPSSAPGTTAPDTITKDLTDDEQGELDDLLGAVASLRDRTATSESLLSHLRKEKSERYNPQADPAWRANYGTIKAFSDHSKAYVRWASDVSKCNRRTGTYKTWMGSEGELGQTVQQAWNEYLSTNDPNSQFNVKEDELKAIGLSSDMIGKHLGQLRDTYKYMSEKKGTMPNDVAGPSLGVANLEQKMLEVFPRL